MDLRNLSESQLQRINERLQKATERLAEFQNGQIDFNDPDIEQAEKQALDYVERRKQGYRNLEIESDSEIRNGVREFLKKRAVYRKDEPEKMRDLSITKPNY